MNTRLTMAALALCAAGLAACAKQDKAADTASAVATKPDSGPTAVATAAPAAPVVTDTAWRTLFDGTGTDQWRAYKGTAFPDSGWRVVDGTLQHTKGGGDIVTKDQWGDFELELEWKIQKGGNSGIFYRATEEPQFIYESAPEMQVLDDARHPDGKDSTRTAGADYALYAPKVHAKPAGEWNAVRVVAKGNHVEHWMNGQKVVEYELGSPDWTQRVQASKFKEWPGYGKATAGHIGLQDHGDTVSYRNIRIRALR